VDTILA
ncbi:hypothetical protein BLA29_015549, partial [Euroglyphus maynei]